MSESARIVMKHWRGWGPNEGETPKEITSGLRDLLKMLVGDPSPLPLATLNDILKTVPTSRLVNHALVDTDVESRLRHARGQSFPDWLAMRSGDINCFPDGVARPQSTDQVRELLIYAKKNNVRVIPYGGGTSVVGHINPDTAEHPVLTVDMGAMNSLIHLDEDSHLATFGAGATGPQIEQQLQQHGFTLGHYPQSWEFSTVGGWVASRSSGQQSLHYGRIEQLFAGAHLESFVGPLDLPAIPASAAGPDIREVILGSEGRMGILTEVTLRISPLPEQEHFKVVFLKSWDAGIALAKQLVQQRVALSMLRLSNPLETASQIAMHKNEHGSQPSVSLGHVMMTFAVTGSVQHCLGTLSAAHQMCANHDAIDDTTDMGQQWAAGRFQSPYLRDPLGNSGYAVDTMETAINWSSITASTARIERAISDALLDEGERVLAYSHLSHVYRQGSSIYTTYVFRLGSSYAQTQERWRKIKSAGASAIVACGGTISHQHGVGKDHRDYLGAEKGTLGIAAIHQLCTLFDPQGLMNPGTLVTHNESSDGR